MILTPRPFFYVCVIVSSVFAVIYHPVDRPKGEWHVARRIDLPATGMPRVHPAMMSDRLAMDSGFFKEVRVPESQMNKNSSIPPFAYGNPSNSYQNVVDQHPEGKTNPASPSLHTEVNQDSDSRLLSVNSFDDWCTFAPKSLKKDLGDVEETVVAYCTKPRNNARVIPDGTVTAAHFVKTPLYVQVMALGNFSNINLKKSDDGGELDPHGQYGKGNPVGGKVTSNVTGQDVFYQEWMNYVSHDEVCVRVCTAGSMEADPRTVCNHVYDLMGCRWVMPGSYKDNSFDSCEADPAYPPGVYVKNDKTSTFQQYNTGTWVSKGPDGTRTLGYTNGSRGQKTPEQAFSHPKSSQCKSHSSISNGLHFSSRSK